jgi:P27 family predicted phage terminase small subunit
MGSRGPLPAPMRGATPAIILDHAAVKPPPLPRGLSAPGKACWRRTWRSAATWLVPELDGVVVERYCRAHDELAVLRARIEQVGRVAVGSMGQPVTHPVVEQAHRVEMLLLKYEAVLGIGAANRARLGLAVAQAAREKSKLDELLERRSHRRSEDPR